jgi:hypothetical protein
MGQRHRTPDSTRYTIYPKPDHKKRTKALVTFAIIVLASTSCGWWYYNERMVSSKVKAAVIAMVNSPNIAGDDSDVYLRIAKLESRTKRDADVVARLDKMASLMRQSSFDKARGRDTRVMDTLSETIKGCSKDPDESCRKLQQSLKELTEQSQHLLEKSKEEQAEAQILFTSLRVDVGLALRPAQNEP